MLKWSSYWQVSLSLSLVLNAAAASHAAAQLYAGQGTWISDDGAVSGTWQGTIDVAGQDLGGDLILTGIPGLTEATIDGIWHPGVIDFATIKGQSEVATVSGTITEPSVAGTFTMPVAVTGTWQGQITLVPDEGTPTPSGVETPPVEEDTPTPVPDDVLTPEEEAALAALEQWLQSNAAPPPDPATPTPTPAPTALPTQAAPDATPTP